MPTELCYSIDIYFFMFVKKDSCNVKTCDGTFGLSFSSKNDTHIFVDSWWAKKIWLTHREPICDVQCTLPTAHYELMSSNAIVGKFNIFSNEICLTLRNVVYSETSTRIEMRFSNSRQRKNGQEEIWSKITFRLWARWAYFLAGGPYEYETQQLTVKRERDLFIFRHTILCINNYPDTNNIQTNRHMQSKCAKRFSIKITVDCSFDIALIVYVLFNEPFQNFRNLNSNLIWCWFYFSYTFTFPWMFFCSFSPTTTL